MIHSLVDERHGAVDAVAEFADVAGPSMGERRLFGQRAEAADASVAVRLTAFSRNRSSSQTMSSGRFRSGGISTGSTASRK